MIRKLNIDNYKEFDPKHAGMAIILSDNKADITPNWLYNTNLWYHYEDKPFDKNIAKSNFMDKLGFKTDKSAFAAIDFFNNTIAENVSFHDIYEISGKKYGLLKKQKSDDIILLMDHKLTPNYEYTISNGSGGYSWIMLSSAYMPTKNDLKMWLQLFGHDITRFKNMWKKFGV